MQPRMTYILPDQETEHREREGFIGVVEYASMKPYPNELGCITENPRNYWTDRGMWVHEVDIVERIIVK